MIRHLILYSNSKASRTVSYCYWFEVTIATILKSSLQTFYGLHSEQYIHAPFFVNSVIIFLSSFVYLGFNILLATRRVDIYPIGAPDPSSLFFSGERVGHSLLFLCMCYSGYYMLIVECVFLYSHCPCIIFF